MERTRALIASTFKTWWEALDPVPFPIEFDNLAGGRAANPSPWGRLSIIQGNAHFLSIGARDERVEGFMTLQVFLPEGKGTAIATRAGQAIGDHFDGAEVNATDGAEVTTNVCFYCTSAYLAGSRDGYQQYNISTAFRRDTFRP